MDIKASIHWEKDLVFMAELDGFHFAIDGAAEERRGPKPKGLTLVSLAGCTGMDVIDILKKMRKEISSFTVMTEAKVADDHPKKIQSIHITYQLAGPDLDAESVKKAVELSQGKYCGVSATLSPAVAITYEIRLNKKPGAE